jgi:hypothetical protein
VSHSFLRVDWVAVPEASRARRIIKASLRHRGYGAPTGEARVLTRPRIDFMEPTRLPAGCAKELVLAGRFRPVSAPERVAAIGVGCVD